MFGSLLVDDNWKRNGIGKLLLQEARKHAIKLGAEKIYVSAIPSAETIAFLSILDGYPDADTLYIGLQGSHSGSCNISTKKKEV